MEDHFSKYGAVSQVHIVINKETRHSEGYGFVLFAQPESAARYNLLCYKTLLLANTVDMEISFFFLNGIVLGTESVTDLVMQLKFQ